MKKYILTGSVMIFSFVMFFGVVGAQEQPIIQSLCPRATGDWNPTITCLEQRIQKLEIMIAKLTIGIGSSQGSSEPSQEQRTIMRSENTGQIIKSELEEGKFVPPRFGASGQSIDTIQKFLKAEGSFTAPQATGYFGEKTKEAVKQFQEKYGIPTSGQIDTQTFKKIQELAPKVAPQFNMSLQKLGGSLLKNLGQ